MAGNSCAALEDAKTESRPDSAAPHTASLLTRVLHGLGAAAALLLAVCARICGLLGWAGPYCKTLPSGDAAAYDQNSGSSAPAKNRGEGGKYVGNRRERRAQEQAEAKANKKGGKRADSENRKKESRKKGGKNGKKHDKKNKKSDKKKNKKGRAGGGGRKNGASKGQDGGKPSDIMSAMVGSVCLGIGLSLLKELGIDFATRSNAVYGIGDMYRMLVSMCDGSGGGSTAEGQHRNSKLGGILLPSRSWLFRRIKQVRHDYMLVRAKKMVRRSVMHAKRRGMFRRPIIVAIDEHDIPFHAKCMSMIYAVSSRRKKGTKWFNRIITVFCVIDGERFVLGQEVIRTKEEKAVVVRRLLRQCGSMRIAISDVIMDRGYYSTEVMEAVREEGHTMLMPAVKLDNIKDLIKAHDAGELAAISTHTISNGTKSESFTLVIMRRPDKKENMPREIKILSKLHEKEVLVEDRYYVFATTMSESRIGGDPGVVAKAYGARWGIENSYKSYEQLRPWTTSSCHSVRILLWFLPSILYNIWMLARFLTAKKAGECARPPLPLCFFVACLLAEVTATVLAEKPPD